MNFWFQYNNITEYLKYLWNNKTLISYKSYIFRTDAIAYAKELSLRRVQSNKDNYKKISKLPTITVGKRDPWFEQSTLMKRRAKAAFHNKPLPELKSKPYKPKGKTLREIDEENISYAEKHAKDFSPQHIENIKVYRFDNLLKWSN
jgi:hypothetical protein